MKSKVTLFLDKWNMSAINLFNIENKKYNEITFVSEIEFFCVSNLWPVLKVLNPKGFEFGKQTSGKTI